MKKKDIFEIFRLKSTVLTFNEISLVLRETNLNLLKRRINHYVKTKKLYSPRKGIYAKDKNYDRFELATKIYTPSYISLETVLENEGVIFQHYKSIYAVSYLNREIKSDDNIFIYKKIKDIVLSNSKGIEKKENYFIATKERAFLDILYLYKDYYFDNLKSINWNDCFDIVKIYENKSLIKRLKEYYKNAGHK